MRAVALRWGDALARIARTFPACLILAAGVLAMSGCTTTRAHSLPDGQAGVIVDCSGATLTWSHCFREAGATCPHGYTIVKRSSKGGGHVVSGDFLQVFGNSADHRHLLIHCRSPGSPPPASADPAAILRGESPPGSGGG